MLAALAAFESAAAQAASLSVDPDRGRPGTLFGLFATGFRPGEPIQAVTFANQPLQTTPAHPQADGAGQVQASARAPNLAPGSYLVEMVGASGNRASDRFTITSAASPKPSPTKTATTQPSPIATTTSPATTASPPISPSPSPTAVTPSPITTAPTVATGSPAGAAGGGRVPWPAIALAAAAALGSAAWILRRRGPGATTAETGPTPAPAAPVRAPCECQEAYAEVKLTDVETKASRADYGTGVGWMSPGVTIKASIYADVRTRGDVGELAGTITLRASKVGGDWTTGHPTGGWGLQDFSGPTIGLVGDRVRRFTCQCPDPCGKAERAEWAIQFPDYVKEALERNGQVSLYGTVSAELEVGTCKHEGWAPYYVVVTLDRGTGRCSARFRPERTNR